MIFDKIYMVKGLSAADESSNNVIILPHPLDPSRLMSSREIEIIGLNAGLYKCVQVAQNFQFSGGEIWAQIMTFEDYEHNQYNPIFFDLSSTDATKISETLIRLGAPQDNSETVKKILWNGIIGELFKNAFLWTNAEKLELNTYYQNLMQFSSLGNIGALLSMLNEDLTTISQGGTVTAIDRDNNLITITKLTAQMLNTSINLCLEYKRKFPDGLV